MTARCRRGRGSPELTARRVPVLAAAALPEAGGGFTARGAGLGLWREGPARALGILAGEGAAVVEGARGG